MSLVKSVFVQASLTALSRLLGFARDTVLLARIGAGPIGDVWNTAQQLPNLFRRILAEGAFSQAFSPIYARTRAEQGDEEARRIAGEAMSVLFTVTLAVTIVIQLAMPWIMLLLMGAYHDDPNIFNLAVIMTQITMPYLMGMALSALFAGVLNAQSRFALSAFAPSMINICILVPALIFAEPVQAALAASVAILVSGFMQAGLLWYGMLRQGIRLKIMWPKLTPDVKRIMMIALPGSISASAVQVNILISQSLAGMEVGAKSWLAAADRLYQLPLGMIGVAVGVTILPRLARAAAGTGDVKAASETLDEGLAFSMAFTLPAAAALLAIPFFLVDGLFVRGAYHLRDALMTSDVLFHFAWGVPAFVIAKVLAPAFFARQDTKRPMRYALMSVAFTIIIGVSGFFLLKAMGEPGVRALAVATSGASWLNVFMMWSALQRLGWYKPSAKFWFRMGRIALACAALFAVLWGLQVVRDPIEGALFGSKELALALVCTIGMVVYAGAALGLRAVTMDEIRSLLKRPARNTKEAAIAAPPEPPPAGDA
jgi:putative peptidoglycan lipid II flippase